MTKLLEVLAPSILIRTLTGLVSRIKGVPLFSRIRPFARDFKEEIKVLFFAPGIP